MLRRRVTVFGTNQFCNFETFRILLESWEGKFGPIEEMTTGSNSPVNNLSIIYAKRRQIPLHIIPKQSMKYGIVSTSVRNAKILEGCKTLVLFPSDNCNECKDIEERARRMDIKIFSYDLS